MAPMPLRETDRTLLLKTARRAIEYGLSHHRPPPQPAAPPPPLDRPGASFVTLRRNGELRGCIGTLEARRPLLTDVAENAYAAAFRDQRFLPLQADELDDLHISVSVLTQPEGMAFENERDLLAQLRPGRDGLILEDGGRRGTFLPSVWESLPTPEAFLTQLRLKAGLAPDHWSDSVRVWRYETESFGDADA
jgi:AmmeMemoRadiSam system protein A